MDGQTVLTEATNFLASEVTMGGVNKDLKELHATIKQLIYSVTAQSETLAALNTKKTVAAAEVKKN